MNNVKLTLIGGPTVLLEIGGLRLLTDPTFDPPGREYRLGPVTLHKLSGPAQAAEAVGRLDAVLLSHEQHRDNLDDLGRELLATVPRVFTTPQSAANLGPNALGLAPWAATYLTAPDGRRLRITATPARHGPHGAEAFSGDVAGFVLHWEDDRAGALYVSGDTVWYEGVAEIAQRFDVRVALVNLGAARIEVVGPVDLTMNAAGALATARAFSNAVLVPAHYEGWAHFQEPGAEVARVFAAAGLSNRLLWLAPGVATEVG
ncbi:MBL fold metallo-hydrolase [Hymenobacter sp.]|uniref:MBL fold metallo-hydrolase n=1 Tax=Hymenobacter sp. TaxID=1898978 RepID=UPI00286C5A9F|nr:MBL fold metallo-hydrolase [Hymenobacter sp.]